MAQTFQYSAETPYGKITRKSHRNYTHVVAMIYADAQPGNQIGEVTFCGSATLAQKKMAAMNHGRRGPNQAAEAQSFSLIRQ